MLVLTPLISAGCGVKIELFVSDELEFVNRKWNRRGSKNTLFALFASPPSGTP
jgi:hypothetical protein